MKAKQPLLLAAHLRADWEQVQQNVAASRYELRRAIQLAVSAYAVLAFVAQPLQPLRAWLPMLQLAALGLIFTGFTFCFVHLYPAALVGAADCAGQSRRFKIGSHRAPALVALCGGVVLLATLASLTMPHDLRPEVMHRLPFLPPWLAVLIPITSLGFLATRFAPRSPTAHLLALASERCPRALLIGAAAGGCLGLHFWIAYTAWLPGRPAPSLTPEHLVWVLAFILGFQALGEEIFFRGVVYRLYENESRSHISNLAPILLLNTFVYLLPGLVTVLSDVWPWRVAYGLAFAGLATWLRDREGSLVASFAANATFTLLLMLRGVL